MKILKLDFASKVIKVFIIFLSFVTIAQAQMKSIGAGISVTPKRLLLTSDKPNAIFTLKNSGKQPMTIVVKAIDQVMDKNGKFIKNKAPINSLGRSLRYSPRKVKLKPGQIQKVRVMLRSVKKFQGQEYSKRISFTAINDKKDIFKNSKDAFNIIFTSATVCPILYWPKDIEEVSLTVKDIKAKIIDGKLEASFTEVRSGKKSILYRRYLYWESPDGARKLLRKGTKSIYYPTTIVKSKYSIDDIPDLDKNGKLIVEQIPEKRWK